MTLYEMSEGALALYEMFYNGDIDEETLNDTIESFGVEDKLEDYCKLIRQLGADVIALKAEKALIDQKIKRADNTSERLKNNILRFFESTSTEKQKAGTFNLALRKTEAVNVVNLDVIPEEFKTTEITVKPDKNSIKAAIKLGKEIPGAEIQINKSINIK
jgi:hypothetical protein